MQVDYINSLLFAFHVLLFMVKLYMTYKLWSLFKITGSDNRASYLMVYTPLLVFVFIFNFIILLSELNYIFTFYIVVDVYYYEYLAITDEIVFTLIALKLLLKREEDGKGCN